MLVSHFLISFHSPPVCIQSCYNVYFIYFTVQKSFKHKKPVSFPMLCFSLELAQEWTSADCSQAGLCLSLTAVTWRKKTWYWGPEIILPNFSVIPQMIHTKTKTTRYCSLTRLWALGPNAYRGVEHSCSAPHSELVKVLWVWTEWGMWTFTWSSTSRCKRKLIKV